jgi:hypothetical protein
VADYSFMTTWNIRAPLADVWNTILDSRSWPSWWPSVLRVDELFPGDEQKTGNLSEITWRGALPYTLTFRVLVTTVIPMEYMDGLASGDLDGRGRWYFSHEQGITQVRYAWDVRTGKAWMNVLAPVLRPVFRWNHDGVMQKGGTGLAKKLNAEL